MSTAHDEQVAVCTLHSPSASCNSLHARFLWLKQAALRGPYRTMLTVAIAMIEGVLGLTDNDRITT